jgi:hypothetical protein
MRGPLCIFGPRRTRCSKSKHTGRCTGPHDCPGVTVVGGSLSGPHPLARQGFLGGDQSWRHTNNQTSEAAASAPHRGVSVRYVNLLLACGKLWHRLPSCTLPLGSWPRHQHHHLASRLKESASITTTTRTAPYTCKIWRSLRPPPPHRKTTHRTTMTSHSRTSNPTRASTAAAC